LTWNIWAGLPGVKGKLVKAGFEEARNREVSGGPGPPGSVVFKVNGAERIGNSMI
jgi:hypothetical protein